MEGKRIWKREEKKHEFAHEKEMNEVSKIILRKERKKLQNRVAPSAGTVEYADGASAKRKDNSTGFLDMTRNNLIPVLELGGMWWITSLLLLPSPLWSIVVGPMRQQSMGQTNDF